LGAEKPYECCFREGSGHYFLKNLQETWGQNSRAGVSKGLLENPIFQKIYRKKKIVVCLPFNFGIINGNKPIKSSFLYECICIPRKQNIFYRNIYFSLF